MKKLMIFAALLTLLVPGAAFAGASTNAALGLGAFAVFNQIISGTGIFGGVAPRPVIVAPQPVYVAPAPVVVAPPPPRYIVAPRPVVVAPAPVFVRPAPVYVYGQHPRGFSRAHGHPGHWKHDRRWR